jgi:tetratricopeptide (TPR) repeat protein
LSYFKYLIKTFWPAELGVFYPHRYLHYPMVEPVVTGPILLGAAVLLVITAAVLLRLKSEPYLATGWFWFLGMLVPVIGLVQVGSQAMADRYMYLPLIGLSICLIWGAADFLHGCSLAAPLSATAAGLVLLACAGLTWEQVGYWHDDVALFGHTLAVTTNNPQAHFNLGTAFGRQGKYDDAVQHLRTAVTLNPTYADAHYSLGFAYMSQGKLQDAAEEYKTVVRLRPDYFAAHLHLASVLLTTGQPDAALERYQEAAQLQPGSPLCEVGIAKTLCALRRFSDAAAHLGEAVRLCPNDAQLQLALGNALFESGRTNEAVQSFAEAARLDPAVVEKLLTAGKTLLSRSQIEPALVEFTTALRVQPENAEAHENVALIYAQQNKLEQAIPHFERCLDLRRNAQSYYNLGLARVMQGRVHEALTNYQEAVKLNPDWPTALNDLAWLLATAPRADTRNGTEAVRLAERACQLDGGKEARFWGTLDAAYAEAGRFDDAINTAEKARQLAAAANQSDLVKAAETRLGLYRNHQPFRQMQ